MLSLKLVLKRDAFIKNLILESDQSDSIGLFSSDGNLGVSLSTDEIVQFSSAMTEIYLELIKVISSKFSAFFQLPEESIKVVCRRAIVPLSHCFFERLFRIQKAVLHNSTALMIQEENDYPTPQTIEELDGQWIHIPAFNQYIISMQSEIWGLKKFKAPGLARDALGLQAGFKNNLSQIRKQKISIERLYRFAEQLTERLPVARRIPVLSFANSEKALRLRGFYVKDFKRVEMKWPLKGFPISGALREEIFSKNSINLLSVEKLLRGIGCSEKQFFTAEKLLWVFLGKMYPIEFLEGLKSNYAEAEKVISKFEVPVILSAADGDTRSTIILSVARARKFKIIKAQHGGEYGYIKDSPMIMERELPFVDVFLTWGWTKIPLHPALEKLELHPLPSPWLSERKQYWSDFLVGTKKPFDILWMPQMMKRFTGAPQGALSIRRDVIGKFSNYMIDFTSQASEAGIRVYCKPYNPTTLHLMAPTYKKINQIGGQHYECSERFDKGLTYDLINKANLVVWDKPGTGFLECISCGIPTMILWSRIYCEEEDWCVNDFKKLEEAGIVHRTSKTLLDEYRVFSKYPRVWMENPSRKEVIQNFLKKYALTDDKWWKIWRAYLSNLKLEVACGQTERSRFGI